MSSDVLKKYRYDMRNEFLTEMYGFSKAYSDRLYFLNITSEENLVEIIRNKIWEMAELFEQVDYNYFFQTEIGNVILTMFCEMLEKEEEELYYIEAKVNANYIVYVLYRIKKELFGEKWLLRYRKLCDYYTNVSLDDIMDKVLDRFVAIANDKDVTDEVRLLLISDFKDELEYLTGSGKLSDELDKILVKKKIV